jgi:hypothetical protein
LATEAHREFKQTGGNVALWAGLLLAPVAWGAQQGALYTMVPWACATGHAVVMHAVSVAAVLVAATGALVSWRNWTRAGRTESDDERGGARARSRFLAVSGLVASLFFIVVIIAQWSASFVLHPCMF